MSEPLLDPSSHDCTSDDRAQRPHSPSEESHYSEQSSPWKQSSPNSSSPVALSPVLSPRKNADAEDGSIFAFFFGVFSSQVANNALQVTLPLMILSITESPSKAAFVSAGTNAADAIGTIVGGRVIASISPRMALILASFVRGLTLALVSSLHLFDAETFEVLTVLYLWDAFLRGITDTARTTIPLLFVGKDKDKLDALNSRYQVSFEVGVLLGPLITGFLMHSTDLNTANWVPAIGSVITTCIFYQMPGIKLTSNDDINSKTKTLKSPVKGLKIVLTTPSIVLPFLGVFALQAHRLKSILPAIFVKDVLGAQDGTATAWLVAAYGLGGVTGSSFFGIFNKRFAAKDWVLMCTVGVSLLAFGWLPSVEFQDQLGDGAFAPYAVCIFLFVNTNVCARLALRGLLMKNIPDGSAGIVMGLSRFSEEIAGMIYKFVVGAIFKAASDGSPRQAYWHVTFFLIAFIFGGQFLEYIGLQYLDRTQSRVKEISDDDSLEDVEGQPEQVSTAGYAKIGN
eukprot:GFYU01003386.1.p1 GENE.GFYU01003386.1~~GFYU01003386.1.p1  ORF type:complete len:511 (+),score=38.48 GFYU01003386.1:144-1676(+)